VKIQYKSNAIEIFIPNKSSSSGRDEKGEVGDKGMGKEGK